MKIINVTIEGTTPLLLNRFGIDAATRAEGPRQTFVGDRGTPHEVAEGKLYLGSDGKTLVIPQPNLFRCIIDGGKFFKAGKSKITTLKSSLIPACLVIRELEIPIQHKQPWEVDTRPVRIPATGGRILAHRPMFHDWALTFTCELDLEILDAKVFRQVVDASGKRIGLGDFRPDCKGPFGRFVVTNWAEEQPKALEGVA